MGRGIIVELIVKHFQELTTEELFEIYKLRISVFVVEQHCPYQEVDDADRNAYHVFFKDDSGILAYARVLPAGEIFEDVSLGRVISVKRRCGLGSEIVMQPSMGTGAIFRPKHHHRSSGLRPSVV